MSDGFYDWGLSLFCLGTTLVALHFGDRVVALTAAATPSVVAAIDLLWIAIQLTRGRE